MINELMKLVSKITYPLMTISVSSLGQANSSPPDNTPEVPAQYFNWRGKLVRFSFSQEDGIFCYNIKIDYQYQDRLC
jgi:hypothetical protein